MIHSVKALDGQMQEFNTYPQYEAGTKNIKRYLVRFFVDDYVTSSGKKHPQFAGKGCSFVNQEDAVMFGKFIASRLKKARSWSHVKGLTDANAAYKKYTSTSLKEVFQ